MIAYRRAENVGKVKTLHTGVVNLMVTKNKMAKYNRNSGKLWQPREIVILRNLARQNTPTRVIGLKLGRTESGVRAKASQQGISLEPHNQSPYNRNKK